MRRLCLFAVNQYKIPTHERVKMLFPSILFILAGLIGTILALRLMAIEAQEQSTILTKRGRIVVGIFAGVIIGIIVVGINGVWWNCDSSSCQFTWGY